MQEHVGRVLPIIAFTSFGTVCLSMVCQGHQPWFLGLGRGARGGGVDHHISPVLDAILMLVVCYFVLQ